MRELAAVPVIVLSNNDGCAIARSSEAKALGIKIGDPYFKICELCRAQGVRVCSRRTTPSTVTCRGGPTRSTGSSARRCRSNPSAQLPEPVGRSPGTCGSSSRGELRATVRTRTLICIGIGPTKTLAKLQAMGFEGVRTCAISTHGPRVRQWPDDGGGAGSSTIARIGLPAAVKGCQRDEGLRGDALVLQRSPRASGAGGGGGRTPTQLGERLRRRGWVPRHHGRSFYHTSERDRGELMRSVLTTVRLPEHSWTCWG